MTQTIETLTEQNFQEFLIQNQKQIFVYETEDYEYQQYFPTAFKILGSTKVRAIYRRQVG